jgi:hypothetical protein
MLRGLILLILIGGAVLFTLPFVVSSVYVDQRGITIPGRVYSKREDVMMRNYRWVRSCEITVEYHPPDTSSVAFLGVKLQPEQYDSYRKGQAVSLHYLLLKDIPDLPMAHVLSQVHALPTARLAGQRAFSAWEAFFTRSVMMICAMIGGLVVLLVVWRKSGFPGFAFAVFGCVLLVVAGVMVSEFPLRLPGPTVDVRRASGKVKTVDRVRRLFSGRRSRGTLAAQPMAVVGVEFVPDGRVEPVLAIDVIDFGSVSGLKEGAAVGIDYESGAPRTAYIQGATRNFPAKNLRGLAVDGVLCVLVVAGMLAVWYFLGRAWDRLLQRRT